MDIQILRQKLDRTPLVIRSWLGSESVVDKIKSINQQYGFKDDNQSIIPRLILRLEIHDLEPKYFTSELANQIKIDRDKALVISGQIRQSVLNQIKKELFEYGVDISLLDKFEISPSSHAVAASAAVPTENIVNLKPAEPPAQKVSPLAPIKPAPAPAFETVPIPQQKEDTAKSDKEKLSKIFEAGSAKPETKFDQPFMLHQVTEVKPDDTTPVDKRSRGGLFWFAGSGKLPEKETKAKIQIEEDKIGKPEYKTESKVVSTPQTPVRIVHYSEFKSPVSPFGTEGAGAKNEAPSVINPQPPKPPVPPEAKGIPMVGSKPEQKPVTPLAPRIIKPETSVMLKKPDMPALTPEPKPPLRDINITMNMGAPAPQPAKEEPKISYVPRVSRVEPPPVQINEPPFPTVKKSEAAKDQNININISVTPPAQGIPMVGKSVSQGAENKKQEPILLIPEVPEFKQKPAAPDVPPAPKRIDDDVVDLRTFEIKKGGAA